MFDQLRNRHLFFLDILFLSLAAYGSYVLRLNRFDIAPLWPGFLLFAAMMVAVTAAAFRAAGIYSRYWLYASVDELLLLIGAVMASVFSTTLAAYLVIAELPETYRLPASIPAIFLFLAVPATATPRLLLRFLRQSRRCRPAASALKRVLIMGAGDAGAMIVRELRRNGQLGLQVAGFVDDDPAKQNLVIHGVPVLGDRHAIPVLVNTHDIAQVIIAMPTAPGQALRGIVALCEKAGVQTKTIPGIYELLDGAVKVSQLRDVAIEDLLRREPVRTDVGAVRELLAGKRVLVTGAGGSIGSELCRQILHCRPAELILLGHGENSIFECYHELCRLDLPALKLTPVIADVRFAEPLSLWLQKLRPQVVFHAAAHKHVPLMELNPAEAIANNVLGTRNLLAAAQAAAVEHFVMISTDKAVNPTSVMGASKRVAELLVLQAARQSRRPYVAVRFGNVLGSRGSVVLTFKQQIAAGGPVTVTDPEMTRYFMTIPEAVQLVLQAAVLGRGGEVFVLDMGRPVKIVDLARDMIELSGLQVGRDVAIEFTGTRPGEKLFEELFVSGEDYRCTRHEKIFIAANASSFVPADLSPAVETLAFLTWANDNEAILRRLQRLVPEFEPVCRPDKLPVSGGQLAVGSWQWAVGRGQ